MFFQKVGCMKIIYKCGDLLQCSEKWLLHGCNAQGVMGSGVALAIKKKYPSAYLAYLASKEYDGMQLGVVTFAEHDYSRTVFNGITQQFYGRDGKQYVDYWAVREVMQAMNFYATSADAYFTREGVSIAMPMIGAGTGGGDWDVISKIIEDESTNFQPVVYYLDAP